MSPPGRFWYPHKSRRIRITQDACEKCGVLSLPPHPRVGPGQIPQENSRHSRVESLGLGSRGRPSLVAGQRQAGLQDWESVGGREENVGAGGAAAPKVEVGPRAPRGPH